MFSLHHLLVSCINLHNDEYIIISLTYIDWSLENPLKSAARSLGICPPDNCLKNKHSNIWNNNNNKTKTANSIFWLLNLNSSKMMTGLRVWNKRLLGSNTRESCRGPVTLVGHGSAWPVKIKQLATIHWKLNKQQKQLDNCVLRTQPRRVCTAWQVA